MSRVARISLLIGPLVLAIACGSGETPVAPVVPDPAIPPVPVVPVPAPALVTYTGPHAATFASWQEQRGPAGGFSVRMPGSAVDEVSEQDTPLGKAATHAFSASSDLPVAYLMVNTTDFPTGFVGIAGNDTALGFALDGMVQGSGGTLVDEQKTTLSGYAARRFRISATAEGVPLEMVGKVFVVNDRVYIVAASTTDLTVNEWADGWLETFRLL